MLSFNLRLCQKLSQLFDLLLFIIFYNFIFLVQYNIYWNSFMMCTLTKLSKFVARLLLFISKVKMIFDKMKHCMIPLWSSILCLELFFLSCTETIIFLCFVVLNFTGQHLITSAEKLIWVFFSFFVYIGSHRNRNRPFEEIIFWRNWCHRLDIQRMNGCLGALVSSEQLPKSGA